MTIDGYITNIIYTNFCRIKGIRCNWATSDGYCGCTACKFTFVNTNYGRFITQLY